jgi:hypothetical protein
VLRRIVILLAGALMAIDLVAETPNPYPNELEGLRFYAQYLSPLIPLRTYTKQQVEQVLGRISPCS